MIRWSFPFTWTSAPSITTTVSAEVVVMLDYAGEAILAKQSDQAVSMARQVDRETTI